MNTIISLGMDRGWRDWAARQAVVRPARGCSTHSPGTGLVGLRAARLGGSVTLADVSPGMLAVAEDRARRGGLHGPRPS